MNKKVLIVEDEEGFRGLLGDIMDEMGWDVESAADGRIGFEMVEKNTYDLILSDVSMPNLSGIDFLSNIRASVNNSHTITLLMSGAFKAKDIEELVSYELGGFLEKPFSQGKLMAAIDSATAKKAKLRENLSNQSTNKFNTLPED